MIQAEAVEAAARAHYDLTHRTKWVQLSQGYKRELLIPFIAALEAAAPYIERVALVNAGVIGHSRDRDAL